MLGEKISVRVDKSTKKRLEELAESEERTTSDFCRFILTRFSTIKTPAQIAIIQILKGGEDMKKAEQFLDKIVKEDGNLEIDKIVAKKAAELIGGKK